MDEKKDLIKNAIDKIQDEEFLNVIYQFVEVLKNKSENEKEKN